MYSVIFIASRFKGILLDESIINLVNVCKTWPPSKVIVFFGELFQDKVLLGKIILEGCPLEIQIRPNVISQDSWSTWWSFLLAPTTLPIVCSIIYLGDWDESYCCFSIYSLFLYYLWISLDGKEVRYLWFDMQLFASFLDHVVTFFPIRWWWLRIVHMIAIPSWILIS